MATLTCTFNKARPHPDGGVVVQIVYSDGYKDQRHFKNLQDAKEQLSANFLNKDNRETLLWAGLARYFFLNPNGGNVGQIEGHTVTFTDESNSVISVS